MSDVDQDEVLSASKIIALSEKKSSDEILKFNGFALNIRSIGSDLARLPRLEVLSLSLNSIERLEPLSTCTSLRELHLRKNNISNLLEIAYLAQLPRLRILLLSDNPCCSDYLYRIKVLRLLPNLKKLDSSFPTEEECTQSQSSDPDLEAFDRAVGEFIGKNSASMACSQTLSVKHTNSEDMKSADDATAAGTSSFHDRQNILLDKGSSNAFQAIKILLNDLSSEEICSLRRMCDSILEK